MSGGDANSISKQPDKAKDSVGPDRALDAWLRRQLDSLYRNVLEAPLPPEFEALARQLDAELKRIRDLSDPDRRAKRSRGPSNVGPEEGEDR